MAEESEPASYSASEIERLQRALDSARSIGHDLNQDLGIIVGRSDILVTLVEQAEPALATQARVIRDAALRLGEKVVKLQRTCRLELAEPPGPDLSSSNRPDGQ